MSRHRRQPPTLPCRSDCPWCAREWGERITGHRPCRRHAREISEKSDLGAMLIDTLQEITVHEQEAA
jgi:hypothetical protein